MQWHLCDFGSLCSTLRAALHSLAWSTRRGEAEIRNTDMQHVWPCSPAKDVRRMSDFGCENAQAIYAAPNVFTTMEEGASKRCDWQPSRGYPSGLLGPSCHLFARK